MSKEQEQDIPQEPPKLQQEASQNKKIVSAHKMLLNLEQGLTNNNRGQPQNSSKNILNKPQEQAILKQDSSAGIKKNDSLPRLTSH